MVTLGCPKNVVDAEEIAGALQARGHRLDARAHNGDIVVVHTCGFVRDAQEESVNAVLQAVEDKRAGRCRRVVVTGCLAQRFADALRDAIPEVDGFVGTGSTDRAAEVIASVEHAEAPLLQVERRPRHVWQATPTRALSTPPWTAYLKIGEGCGHRCSFCAIPAIRGPHVSKPFEAVLAEARHLAGQGVKELNVVSQDSTQYGYDLGRRSQLAPLLRELARLPGIRWVRALYCYPSRLTLDVIEAIVGTPGVCAYVDLPLQHADEGVLRAMRRPGSGQAYLRLIRRIRRANPDACIRTTFITGFPGETEEAFASLQRFVETAEFDRVGVFAYSTEEGTPAARLPGRPSAKEAERRREALLQMQRDISLDRNRRWVGRELEMLVESVRPLAVSQGRRQGRLLRGRTFRDAPEIDGAVEAAAAWGEPGDFVTVRVERAGPYDLFGRASAPVGRSRAARPSPSISPAADDVTPDGSGFVTIGFM